MPDSPAMPLSRFTVLDLTRVRAGPTAVRQLADWGAAVIKIEAPPEPGAGEAMGGPRHGPDFQNLHRNKRSLTLDLKSPEGIEIFRKLVRAAPTSSSRITAPTSKPGSASITPRCSALNPRLVYASISGFGQNGPYRDRPGFDQIAQGMGGLMSITGLPGQGPVRVGIPIADLSAGIFCALGILVALLEREVSGEGQWVESSLLAAQIAMLDFQAARWLIAGEVPEQAGNDHPTSIPTGVFKTKDGHINIASAGDEIFRRLCRALDRARSRRPPGLPDRPAALAEPPGAQRRDRGDHRAARQRRMDRPLQRGRRAGRARSMRSTRSSPTRRSGISGSPRPVEHPTLGRDRAGRPGGVAEPHAEPAQHRQPRARRAHRRDPRRARLRRRRYRRAARARRRLRGEAMPVINRIADFHAEMAGWRHDIHAHPETAFEETATAELRRRSCSNRSASRSIAGWRGPASSARCRARPGRTGDRAARRHGRAADPREERLRPRLAQRRADACLRP